ncbi:MAG: VOC family protein [Roseovarius sp.]
MQLDHLVINTRLGMDAAAELFADLGFHLTPRGHHSLGSINHLMMDPVSYLELVGVPETGKQRQDVLDSPIGLSGLVFRAQDARATCARLRDAGFAPQEPILLERPVTLDGAEHMARFHNVRMTFAEFPVGRVYFCQHLTPDLVWRKEWLDHPNGFCGITGMRVQSPDPGAEAARYAMLAGGEAAQADGGWRVTGGGFALHITEGADRFVDATLAFETVEHIAARAEATGGAEWQPRGGGGVLTIPALGVTLHCHTTRSQTKDAK